MNRKQMIKEIKQLEEFKDYTDEDYAKESTTQLGAILGFWDVGDGGVRN